MRHHAGQRGSPPLARGKRLPARGRPRRPRITPARAGKTRCPHVSTCPHRDHPRSRGENVERDGPDGLDQGSPPLARGKRRRARPRSPRTRITPARAGKTDLRGEPVVLIPDHPRSRGENRTPDRITARHAGSPPLARGKPRSEAAAAHSLRITPARAGKTTVPLSRQGARQDHPRSRGENSGLFAWALALTGSPPLARGKHDRGQLPPDDIGITPARAGKTHLRAAAP